MELYAVGKLVGCFGIKGFLKLQPMTYSAERIESLGNVFVGSSADTATAHHIDEVLENNKGFIVKLRSIDTRTVAETLVGLFVFVREKEVSPPPKGSYFVHDIIGAEVVSEDGEKLGAIIDVYKTPGQDIWVVRRGDKEYMLPVVKEFVKNVDVVAKRVTIHLIEGLLDG